MSEQKVPLLTAEMAGEAAAFCGWESLYSALRAIATGLTTVIHTAALEAKDARIDALHTAICQAVGLMSECIATRTSGLGNEARNILRQALVDYADAIEVSKEKGDA